MVIDFLKLYEMDQIGSDGNGNVGDFDHIYKLMDKWGIEWKKS